MKDEEVKKYWEKLFHGRALIFLINSLLLMNIYLMIWVLITMIFINFYLGMILFFICEVWLIIWFYKRKGEVDKKYNG